MRTLAQIDKKIADLEAKQLQGRDLTEHFHLGMVGGSGKPVQRLNTQRSAELDRTIDRAVEIQKLKVERERLRASAQAPQRMAEYEAKEQEHRTSIEEELKSTKSGDEIVTSVGSQVTIAKVNRKSVISTMGSRYTIGEIVKVIHKEQGS